MACSECGARRGHMNGCPQEGSGGSSSPGSGIPKKIISKCKHKDEYVARTRVMRDGTVWSYFYCPDCGKVRSTTKTEGDE